tara:strand:+ start:4800 stop:6185 length:1386 start_codon:yes stop_codon:yes gene_type:complete
MKISILGGGISGLATAWKLSDEHKVEVFEKTPKIGGMASTFKYKDFLLDYGPHKIYTQLPGILDEYKNLLKDEFMVIPKKNKLYVKGKFLDFPPKISQLATNINPLWGTKCGFSMIGRKLHKDKHSSYESYLKNNFGDEIYNTLFRDYALKVWGDPKELSEELARKRIPIKGFGDLVRGVLFGVKEDQSAENFHYAKYGIGSVSDKIAEIIKKNKGTIKTKHIVSSINIKDNKVDSIALTNKNGRTTTKKTDYLVSTIPITTMIKLMNPAPPKEVIKAVENLKYRSLTILFIIVKKEKVLDCNWIFFPSKDIIFNRISEMKSFSKYCCPKDKTALMVEITCDFNDWRWKTSDYNIFDMAMKDLEKTGILKKADVEEYFTKKANHVYPIYSKNYKKHMKIILDYLDKISNLQTTGRQGLYNYNNTDHCIDMANKTAEYIKKKKSVREWKELREYFDTYTIVD